MLWFLPIYYDHHIRIRITSYWRLSSLDNMVFACVPWCPLRLLGALGRPDGEESPGARPAIVVHVVDAALGGVRQLRRSAWVPTKKWIGWYVIFLVILTPFVRSCCCIATSWPHAYTANSSKCCQWSKFMRWIHALRDLELNGQLPPHPMLQSAQVQQLSHAAVLAVSRHWPPASAKLKRGNWEDQAMKLSFSATLSKASQHCQFPEVYVCIVIMNFLIVQKYHACMVLLCIIMCLLFCFPWIWQHHDSQVSACSLYKATAVRNSACAICYIWGGSPQLLYIYIYIYW